MSLLAPAGADPASVRALRAAHRASHTPEVRRQRPGVPRPFCAHPAGAGLRDKDNGVLVSKTRLSWKRPAPSSQGTGDM